MISFKDFISVDYTGTGDEMLAYRAHKRRRADTTGPVSEDDVEEALTQAQRMKARATFRKNKAKIQRGRKLAAKKLASKDKLQSRAEKKARDVVVNKILKNKSKTDLSFAEREKLEKRVDKKKAYIKKLSKKLLPDVKKKDRAKFKKGE